MYRIHRNTVKTNEEKVAVKMANLLTDFTLDLEKVGYYLARATPYLIYRRSLEVLESAQFQKETVEINRLGYGNDRLF